MFTVEYVVVPVDLSTGSRAAYKLAQSLGEQPPRIHLVHAWGGWPPYMEKVLFPYAPLGEDAVEFEHEIVLAAAHQMAEYFDLPDELPESIDEPMVLQGPPRRVLPEHIQGVAAELIVVGAHGETGVVPHAIGSVTQRLVRTSRRPVLVSRESAGTGISSITVALDLTRGSHVVLEHALGMALHLDADFEIVYVLDDPTDGDSTQVMNTVIDFHPRKVKNKARNRVDALFDSVVKNLDISYSERDSVARLLKERKMLVGDPATVLADHCAKNMRDLLVVGSQDATRKTPGRLGTTADRILRRSPTHVMVIPL